MFKELTNILENGTKEELNEFIDKNNLVIKDGKIFHKNEKEVRDKIEYWDKQQLVKKILLNSLYGAILNPHCRFFDKRIGQSTTLTGRSIAQHMDAHVNKCLTGEYNHSGDTIIYGDTDSCDKDSLIKTSIKDMTIEELFNAGTDFYKSKGKEYSINNNIKVYHYNPLTHETTLGDYNYVYRHKTSKRRFLIKTANGKEVIVTEDHSVMIYNKHGDLIEIKPTELKKGDKVVTII